MPKGSKGLLMWENNPDTPIDASNLSKIVDIQSESKFIKYTDSQEDYTKWADVVENFADWPTGTNIINYVNKLVYNTNDHLAKTGFKTDDVPPMYGWTDEVSPYKKMLKISAYTKIATKYKQISDNKIKYSNFDTGEESQILSVESLLIETDFSPNTTYHIYLYNHTTYGDYAYFKIISDYDVANNTNDWKVGPLEGNSPTGHKVISYREVGGFKTDTNGYIIEDSVWDISIKNEEVLSESYKIIENNDIRLLNASDIPIIDNSSVFNSIDVEGALTESKILLDSLKTDVYFGNSRFGVELKWSPVKKIGSNLVNLELNDISLKITKGYIDVIGTRVKFNEDIYLASTDILIRINNGNFGGPAATNITDPTDDDIRVLGQQTTPDSKIYEGIWRCYINSLGQITFKEDSVERPVYNADYRGWYNNDGERAIGKFKVKYGTNHFYIEKMSVTGTYDERAVPNTIMIFHGSMCPDGLIPCDGRWHDITNNDTNSYNFMPEVTQSSNWQSRSWYEDTPNLWDRTIKMVSQQDLPFDTPEFVADFTGQVLTGSSDDCGNSNDISAADHTHLYNHNHTSGTLSIISSGSHTHTQADFTFLGDANGLTRVQDSATGVEVASKFHTHDINIATSGAHAHTSDKFAGRTSDPDPSYTDSSSSWPPYKEIIFCIRK